MSTVNELHQKWSKNPKYANAFEELAPEYSVARAVIEVRVRAGLTQVEFVRRSGAAAREPVREVRLLQEMTPKAVVMLYEDGAVSDAESGEFVGKVGYLGYF